MDNDNCFPLILSLLKMNKKMIAEEMIIGDGIFKLAIDENNRETITQNDALADFIAIQTTNNKNTMPAFEPILVIEQ